MHNTIVSEAFVMAVFQPRLLAGSAYNSNSLLALSDADPKTTSSAASRTFVTSSLSGSTTGGDKDDENGNGDKTNDNDKGLVSDDIGRRININQAYISTLENNLQKVLDEWMLNGNRVLVSETYSKSPSFC